MEIIRIEENRTKNRINKPSSLAFQYGNDQDEKRDPVLVCKLDDHST